MDDLQKTQDFLKAHQGAVISTVSPEGKPQASFVYYVLDKDLNFYFITKNKTRKAENLMKNTSVAIVVNNESKMETLQMEGTVQLVDDAKLNFDIVNLWLEKNVTIKEGWPPLFKMDKGSIIVFKVNLNWTKYSDFNWLKS